MFSRNLASVEARIVQACARAGRARESVRLLPITKTVPAHILRFAYQTGIRDFGENKIQEAVTKRAELVDLAIDWCIVGHLQTNKVRYLTRFAREFHALDGVRLAETLNAGSRPRRSLPRRLRAGEYVGRGEQIRPATRRTPPFLDGLGQFPRLKPRGLMTLAVFSTDLHKVRPCFERLCELRDKAVRHHPAIRELSMGMSNDFEEAIVQGADVVRVGRSDLRQALGARWALLAGGEG